MGILRLGVRGEVHWAGADGTGRKAGSGISRAGCDGGRLLAVISQHLVRPASYSAVSASVVLRALSTSRARWLHLVRRLPP